MVAVPAYAARGVDLQMLEERRHGRNLIRDRLGRMKVPHIHAGDDLARQRIQQIELMGACHKALAAHAEELGLDRVERAAGPEIP